jgi:deoxyribodipyrimidine photo-lyase
VVTASAARISSQFAIDINWMRHEMAVPEIRIQACNQAPERADAEYVLYWMIANRRPVWNFSLQRAVEHAARLQKPLLVFEGLRSEYQWASDRLHQFVIQGMADNAAAFAEQHVCYYPWLELAPDDGVGLLQALADRACVVVTDDFPSFFLPRMVAAAAAQLPVLLEKVDSNGILPMQATDRVFARAHDFRRYLQKSLRPHLEDFPAANPLAGIKLPKLASPPADILERWPQADVVQMAESPACLDQFPIDHTVSVTKTRGGMAAAERQLDRFCTRKLQRYAEERNQPEEDVASGLSPYLHFGHLSAHQILDRVLTDDGWSAEALAEKATGSREGWWGCSPTVEAFLDELITWREVGYNMASHTDDFDQYESLPEWARKTLQQHAGDPRPHVYSLQEFETADTHDELWNAAQTQLIREGRIHNYLRMLWGKKILHWSESAEAALEIMVELNNKYALDGRNPNSYSGIFWVLGRYDRAWGPERPIFGKVRYMTSDNTARKVRVKDYIGQYRT